MMILPRKLNFPVIPNITVTVTGIAKQLSKHNQGKEAGPDNLTSRILKDLYKEISPILKYILTHESRDPKHWENAFVTPVYYPRAERFYKI